MKRQVSQPRTTLIDRRKLLLIAALVLLIALAYVFRHQLTLARLVGYEERVQAYHRSNPVATQLIAFTTYVAVTAFSLPGATVMTLTWAWFVGFWRAVVLVSLASTAGATLAMLISRYLFRSVVERRFGDRLSTFDAALQREGPYYLATLRLIPVVPFFVVNLMMGLTRIRAWTFCWVSWLAMLPGTCVYVLAGSRFPDLKTLLDNGPRGILSWDVLLAFTLLATFPWITRFAVRRWSANRGAAPDA